MSSNKPKKLKKTNPYNRLNSPSWDLDRDGITFSFLNSFVLDKERFRLKSVEGWREKGIRVPMEFGTLFHKFCESAHVKNIRPIIKKESDKYIARMIKSKNKPDLEELLRFIIIVEVVFFRYLEYWNNTPTFESKDTQYFDRDLKYKFNEKVFDIEHLIFGKSPIKLRGKIDAALTHPITSSVWLQENKTKGRFNEYAIKLALHENFQTMLYATALRHYIGVTPGGVLYNVIRRPQLRQRVRESSKDFAKRIDSDIEKRPSFYFKRWLQHLTEEDLDSWIRRSLDPILYDLQRWWGSIKHNPFDPWTSVNGKINPNHSARPYGVYDGESVNGTGDLFDLVYKRSPMNYEQITEPFQELQDDE